MENLQHCTLIKMETGLRKNKLNGYNSTTYHIVKLKKYNIMKKVILTAAIVLGGLSTFASSAFAINQTDEIMVAVQDDYKEIDTTAIPQAVKDALAADFQTATLDKAHVNHKQEYKLEITVDGAASTVYADKDGNWIEKE